MITRLSAKISDWTARNTSKVRAQLSTKLALVATLSLIFAIGNTSQASAPLQANRYVGNGELYSQAPNLIGATSLNKQVGISINGITGDSIQELNQKFSDISALGFKWIRIDINWSIIQPNNAVSFNWNVYDRIAKAADNNHLQILGILNYTPRWAQQNDDCENDRSCAPEPKAFAKFAYEASKRYSGVINYWEIWNEPNSASSWLPTPDINSYSQLLNSSYTAIKSANRSSYVILGGLDASEGTSSKIAASTFLQGIYSNGSGGSFDAVGFHPYTFPLMADDSTKNTGWSRMVDGNQSIKSIMLANNDSYKPIWVTEYGAPTNGPTGVRVNESSQSRMALTALSINQATPLMGPLFWYTYQDMGDDPSNKENFFGIIRANGTKKTLYLDFKKILNSTP